MKSAIGIFAAACLLVGAETPGAAQDLDGTLKKVKESGVFTIGYRDSSLPLSYLDCRSASRPNCASTSWTP